MNMVCMARKLLFLYRIFSGNCIEIEQFHSMCGTMFSMEVISFLVSREIVFRFSINMEESIIAGYVGYTLKITCDYFNLCFETCILTKTYHANEFSYTKSTLHHNLTEDIYSTSSAMVSLDSR